MLNDDLIDAGLPDPSDLDWGEYMRSLNPDQRNTANALRIDYMDAEQRAAALARRHDLADRLAKTRLAITSRSDIREKYAETIANLDLIIDAETTTAAQVVQAVKFLARTVKLVLKIIARIYREETNGN